MSLMAPRTQRLMRQRLAPAVAAKQASRSIALQLIRDGSTVFVPLRLG